MFDFTFSPSLLQFSATEVVVAAASDRGRAFLASMFGVGAVSVTLPKSRAGDLTRFIEQKGFAWEVSRG